MGLFEKEHFYNNPTSSDAVVNRFASESPFRGSTPGMGDFRFSCMILDFPIKKIYNYGRYWLIEKDVSSRSCDLPN